MNAVDRAAHLAQFLEGQLDQIKLIEIDQIANSLLDNDLKEPGSEAKEEVTEKEAAAKIKETLEEGLAMFFDQVINTLVLKKQTQAEVQETFEKIHGILQEKHEADGYNAILDTPASKLFEKVGAKYSLVKQPAQHHKSKKHVKHAKENSSAPSASHAAAHHVHHVKPGLTRSASVDAGTEHKAEQGGTSQIALALMKEQSNQNKDDDAFKKMMVGQSQAQPSGIKPANEIDPINHLGGIRQRVQAMRRHQNPGATPLIKKMPMKQG
jgi:hypothetical protein